MTIAQIETNLQELIGNFSAQTFIFDLLIAYGFPKSTLARLEKGELNQLDAKGELTHRKQLFFKVAPTQTLHAVIDQLANDPKASKNSPRFIIVTDYETRDDALPEYLKAFPYVNGGLFRDRFVLPNISEKQKEMITEHVFNILHEREQHSDKTLAQLYDPNKMPADLKEGHHQLDLAIERCYRAKPFESDEERLEYLFKMYEEMVGK